MDSPLFTNAQGRGIIQGKEAEMEKRYIAIDLKSFYASVECAARGVDPLDTNLVVADSSRTEKTICLAVSPSLKEYGISGRARLFEVVQRMKEVNRTRRQRSPVRDFTGKSHSKSELMADPFLEADYIVAPPRMALYEQVSASIFDIYQQYVAPEDIHVYSIDEVFIDVTGYLNLYKLTAHELAVKMIRDVLKQTGITATAGIGSNLYLAKVAMDVVAKHVPADADGVRIAELDEMSYRRLLWDHRPLTDFWRVGPGYARRLSSRGLYTMGDVARCSLEKEDMLYDLFGVNAELLIDHAWGWEPCTIADIKAYRPAANSISSGQVLQSAYTAEKGKLIVKEMTDLLVLDLVSKRLKTCRMNLFVGYDVDNLKGGKPYRGEIVTDRYGRAVPKPVTGTETLQGYTSSTKEIMAAVCRIYDRIVDGDLLVRRMSVTACDVLSDDAVPPEKPVQMDLFTDYEGERAAAEARQRELEKERRMQEAALSVQSKFGKNALLKGMDFEEGATTRERNGQIGGHKK